VELVRRLEGAAYPYHTYRTLFADAQAQVLQLLQQIPGPEGALTAVKNPWNFFNASPCRPMRPSSPGKCHGRRPRSAGVYGGAGPATLRRWSGSGGARDHPDSDAGATASSTWPPCSPGPGTTPRRSVSRRTGSGHFRPGRGTGHWPVPGRAWG
jgi:hypothetical protein